MTEVILSIDHGKNSGFSVFIDGKYFASGTFSNEPVHGDTWGEIYDRFRKQLLYYIELYKPTVIGIEKVNVAGVKFGGDNIVKLAGFNAIERLVGYKKGIEIREINPMSMKKEIAGNGRATKLEVAQAVLPYVDKKLDEICVPVLYKAGKKKGQVKSYISEESDSIAFGLYLLGKDK